MNHSSYRKLRVISYVILGILISGFYVEWLADDFRTYLEGVLGDYFNATFLLVGVLGLIAILYFEVGLSSSEKDSTAEKESNRSRIIADTRERYKYRRSQKLNHDLSFEIKLALKFVKTKARDPIHEQFILNTKSKLKDYQQLFELYYQNIHRLLILGEPGSGKTMLLLRLGEYLLNKAEQDDRHPIPIIFNLANWHGNSNNFHTWLTKQLRHAAGEAGISAEYAQELIDSHQILPLLDGLDEVREPLRKDCLSAIEQYLNQRVNQHPSASLYPQLVLCSRIAEFNALKTGAPVLDTIEIKPLTQKAVKETLQGLASERNWAAGQLLANFDQRPALRKALKTAFYVHTALSIIEGNRAAWQGFDLKTTSHYQIQQRIIDQYLDQQLQQLGTASRYKPKVSSYHLSWLAYNLHTQKQSVTFELVDLQLSWWSNTQRAKLVYGLVCGLVCGLIAGLGSGLIFGLVFGLFFGLSGGLALGLTGGLVEAKRAITYDEITTFSFSELQSTAIKKNIQRGLVFGLIAGLIGGLIGELTRSPFGRLVEASGTGLIEGLILGFAFGLLVGFLRGLIDEIAVYDTFPKVSKSWQKIASGLKRQMVFHGSWILLALIIIRILVKFEVTNKFTALQDPPLFLVLFGGYLLSVGLAFLGDSSFRFLMLYLSLLGRGFIPKNLVKFLNQVAGITGLMERDGGQWRFRHQLIHDAFTQRWIEENGISTAPPAHEKTPAHPAPE